MNDEHPRVNRRGFLGVLTGAIAALVAAAYAAPAMAYILGPALQAKAEAWVRLGSTAKIKPGTPTLFKTKVQRRTGWITSEEEVSAYVLTEDGREFVAMSNICTHLGCRVRWVADRQAFFCPCHNGVFDVQGKVVSGPPPRPLDRYQVKVDGGQLFILGG